jgi:hypothetical protein
VRKKKKVKRSTRQQHGVAQLQAQIAAVSDKILKGTLLSIDPSCISASSYPGWARFEKGKLKESGVITGISPHADLYRRLSFIGKWTRTNLPNPDVLVIEQIPVIRTGRLNTSLIQAVGTFLGSFECDHVLEPLPVVWQKFLEQTHDNDYDTAKYYRENMKSDEMDAINIGLSIIKIAKQL